MKRLNELELEALRHLDQDSEVWQAHRGFGDILNRRQGFAGRLVCGKRIASEQVRRTECPAKNCP